MQKVKVTDQQVFGARHLELKIEFSPPKPVGSLRQMGQYSISPRRLKKTLIREYALALDSEGVSVCLVLRSTPHRLYRKDTVFCERSLLRLVQKQLASHHQVSSYKSIRACLVDQLSALVSQDKVRGERESAQNRGLNQPPSCLYDTGLDRARDTLSKAGSISWLLG